MSLLFNIMSTFVIAFLLRNKQPLISWLHLLSTVILEPKKIKVCHCFYFYPIHLPWSDGTWWHDFSFLSINSAFPLSSFTFIKKFFSSSLLSSINVVSSTYLRLLVFLPAVLIPAYASSRLAFHMYSAYKLNKQGDNIQPIRTPFPIWNQSFLQVQF